LPELVKHKYDGYICEKSDIDSIIEGVMYYLLNRSLPQMHGINAFKSISELGLSRATYKEKWMNVFNMI
jgi:hypothetical protein